VHYETNKIQNQDIRQAMQVETLQVFQIKDSGMNTCYAQMMVGFLYESFQNEMKSRLNRSLLQ